MSTKKQDKSEQATDNTYIARVQTEEERDLLRYKSYEQRAKYDPEKVFTRRASRTNLHRRNPDFVYRICNDQDDLVYQRMEMGYDIDYENDFGDTVAGREHLLGSVPLRSVGGGKKAVIMKCPRDIYEARQRKKQERIDRLDRALHGGRTNKFNEDPRQARINHHGLQSGLVELVEETTMVI